MTVYHKTSLREVEIVGADVTGQSGWSVSWTYTDTSDIGEEFGGVKQDPISQLVADDGVEEVMEAIKNLPDNKVKGTLQKTPAPC